jgi:hypothetical protein
MFNIKYSSKCSGQIREETLLDQLSNCHLPKKNPVSWSRLTDSLKILVVSRLLPINEYNS